MTTNSDLAQLGDLLLGSRVRLRCVHADAVAPPFLQTVRSGAVQDTHSHPLVDEWLADVRSPADPPRQAALRVAVDGGEQPVRRSEPRRCRIDREGVEIIVDAVLEHEVHEQSDAQAGPSIPARRSRPFSRRLSRSSRIAMLGSGSTSGECVSVAVRATD